MPNDAVEPAEKPAIKGADDTRLLAELDRGSASNLDTKIVQGDITRLAKPVDAIITPINSGGLWMGGVDTAIQRVAGGMQFHDQATAKLEASGLTEGEALHASQKTDHKGGFKDVVFVVDDLGKPIRDVVYAGLMKAEEAGMKSVAIPATMRMGAMKGLRERTGTEVADEIAKGVEKFLASNPQNVKELQFIVYNGPGSDASDGREVTNRLTANLDRIKNPGTEKSEPALKVGKAEVNAAMERLKTARTEELKLPEAKVASVQDKAESRVSVSEITQRWPYKDFEKGRVKEMPDGSLRLDTPGGASREQMFEFAESVGANRAVSFQFNGEQWDMKAGTSAREMNQVLRERQAAEHEAWLKSPQGQREVERLKAEAVTYGRQDAMDKAVVGLPEAIESAKSGETAPLLKLLGQMEQLDGHERGISVLEYDKKAIGRALIDAGFTDPGTIRMYEAARGNLELKGELIIAMAAENLSAGKQINPKVGEMARNHQYEVEAQGKMKSGARPNGVLEEKARRELVVKAEMVSKKLLLDGNANFEVALDAFKQSGIMTIGNTNVGEAEISRWRQEGKVDAELIEQVRIEAEKLDKLAEAAGSGAEKAAYTREAGIMKEAYADMTGPDAKAAQMRFIDGLDKTREVMAIAVERRARGQEAWQEEQRRSKMNRLATSAGVVVGVSIIGAVVYNMYRSEATRSAGEFKHAPIRK